MFITNEMSAELAMIKLRLDVDYAYPSRLKSFFFTALGARTSRDYLKNSKILAKMINESPEQVKAYWFFTPYTIPDKVLLELLNDEKHEVALHVAKNPYKELTRLENVTGHKVNYYTVHGTARLLARIVWKRKLWQNKAPIPKDFPLKSFYEFPTLGLDITCHLNPTSKAVEIAEDSIAKGDVLHVHPEWLLQRGRFNPRGPFYETLKKILNVDHELDSLMVTKRVFARVASDIGEYERDIMPSDNFLEKLSMREIDIFTFIERKWCCSIPNPSKGWVKTEDNVALLHITSFDDWWKNAGKKTRNMVRKAEKSGVVTRIVEPNEKLAEGIWRIYNETPIRQERSFPHYGQSIESVTAGVLCAQNSTFIGAYLQDKLVGFIQLVHGDNIAVIAQILSLQEHFEKAINNALIAEAVKACMEKKVGWVMYGRIGNHPSLDKFKESNGFTKFPLTRYYVPLTMKGRIAIRLRLNQNTKDTLPQPIKNKLFPFYNWVDRTKLRLKIRLKNK